MMASLWRPSWLRSFLMNRVRRVTVDGPLVWPGIGDEGMNKKKEARLERLRKDLIEHEVVEAKDDADMSDRELLEEIHLLIQKLALLLEKSQIREFTNLMHSPRKLIWLNVLGGIGRGVGIAIGLTVITAVILYFLQLLGALNLPIIGDFIAEIVRIVQRQLDTRLY